MNPVPPRRLNARRGYSIQYRGKTLLSLIDPIAMANRAVDALDRRSGTLYFCPSPLFGYGLERLLDELPERSAVIAIEADSLLRDLSYPECAPLLARYQDRLHLAPASSTPQDLIGIVESRWGLRRFRRVVPVKTNAAWALNQAMYAAMEESLRYSIARSWGNTMTLMRLGRLYTKNLIRNLPLLARYPALPSQSGDYRPLLAFAAGPGSDKLLEYLAEPLARWRRRGKRPFRLLCVDTALLPLRARGLEPDAVLVLEAQYWNLLDFIGAQDTPLLFDLASHYASTRVGRESLPVEGLMLTPWAPLSLFERLRSNKLLPREMPALGSVGLSLMEIARSFTSGPVIFAGLDFAFTHDQFHMKETSHAILHETGTSRTCAIFRPQRAFRPGIHKVRGKDGSDVLTDPALEGYQTLFLEQFATDPRLFDAGPSGLDLRCQRLSPEEVLAILSKEEGRADPAPASREDVPSVKQPAADRQRLLDFILSEEALLERLRDILSGKLLEPAALTSSLLSSLDYLWAHFAEYGGISNLETLLRNEGFLKRVRAEIDRSLKDWQLAERETKKEPDAN